MLAAAALAALRDGFDDPDAGVSAACLRALGAHLPAGAAEEAELLRRCRQALLGREPAPRRAALGTLLTVLLRRQQRGQGLDAGALRAVLAGLGSGDLEPREVPTLAALARDDPQRLLCRALVVGLRGSAWQLRPLCAQALGRQRRHDEVAAALRLGLSDPEPQLRAACAEALGDGAEPWDEATRRELLQALSDTQPQVRAAAAQTLRRAAAEPEVRAALLFAAGDVSGRARLACLEALLPYAQEGAVAALLQAGLTDPYWPVADLCARALGREPPPRPALPRQRRPTLVPPRPLPGAPLSAGELAQGLRHDDPDVRLYCALALAERGDEELARRALCAALLGQDETELYELLPAWMLAPAAGHGRAACALGLSAVAEDVGPRRALLDGLRDGHGEVREACARALAGAARRPEAQDALRALLRDGHDSDDDTEVRAACAAAAALGPLSRRPEARALLIDGLGAARPELRAACAAALERALPEPQVEAALLRTLGDPAAPARRAAAATLAAQPEVLQRCREALGQGLRGSAAALRDGCARALGGLGAEGAPELLAALSTEAAGEPTLRLSLLRALGPAVALPEVVAALAAHLGGDGDAQARACCAELLAPRAAEEGPRAALRAALRDESRFVQRACARALGPGDEAARAHLLEHLRAAPLPDDVRAGAAADLGPAAADEAVQAALLAHLRGDPASAVRRACALALAGLPT